MKKDDIFRVLTDNQIQAFEVVTELDADCDVILRNSNIDEFVRFCNSINQKIAFCEVSFIELDDYIVDENELHEKIEKTISNKLESCYFDDEINLTISDFEYEIEYKLQEIRKHNADVAKIINTLSETEVLFASIYTIYNGVQVGIRLTNEYMDGYQMAFEIDDKLEDTIEELIEPKLAQYKMSELSYYEKFQKDMEKHRNQEKEKRQRAMAEIREFIEGDTSLLECTNQKLRHAYAKRIVEEYSPKLDTTITIGDVEVVADDIYKKSKKNH